MADRRFGGPMLVAAMLVVGVALRWSALDAGLHMDDIAQRAMVEGAYPVPRAWWDLFDFAGGEPQEIRALASRGFLPWWSDPQLRLRALRPLASALVFFDVKVLRTAWLGHAHSLLWWAALLVVLHRFLRRIVPERWATIAVALYALDDCHTFPIAWLANRSAIVSTVFAIAATHAYVRLREEGWRPGRWVAPLFAALSLAAGEYGLAGLAFILAYELVGATGTLTERARAIAPVAAVALAYVGLHRALGYGAAHSSVYVDPFADPAGFVAAAAERVPLLLTDMLLATPLPALVGSGRPAWMLGGGALLLVGGWVALIWRGLPHEQQRRIRWMALAAAGALLPVASSFLSGRLTLVAAVGTHVIVAGLLVDASARARAAVAGVLGRRAEPPSTRQGPATPLRYAMTGLAVAAALGLVFMHGPVAVNSGRAELATIAKLNRAGELVAAAMPVDDRRAPKQRWVLLTAIDPMILIYPPLLRWVAGRPLPAAWWVLSMAAQQHRMERVSPRAIEVSVPGGALLQRPVERFFRSPDRALQAGDVVALDGLEIEVREATADGVTRLRYTFDRRLEHRSLKFFIFGANGLLAYPMGREGTVMSIPPGADPLHIDEARVRASAR